MTSSTGISRNRSRVLAGAVAVTTVAGVLFLGGLAPAQAEQFSPTSSSSDDVSAATVYDGYFIKNETGKYLTIKDTPRQGEDVCLEWDFICWGVFGDGFGKKPATTIFPHATAYFEVAVKGIGALSTQDSTELTYVVQGGGNEEIKLYAGVKWYWTVWGTRGWVNDWSAAKPANGFSVGIDRTTEKGTQTTFHIRQNDVP